jgi:phage virion morphogenesis protein
MNITVKISDSEVRAALQQFQAKVGNLQPVMDRIGLYYLRSVQENFDRQRSPDGTPWQRLAATTLGIYLGKKGRLNKRGYLTGKGRTYLQGKQILIDSGDLRGSVRHQATATSVTIGSDLGYAAIHQFGGLAGRGRKTRIPARPWLAVNRGQELVLADKDRQMIMTIIQEQLQP